VQAGYYRAETLHTAKFQLADFGRAVVDNQLAAPQESLLAAAPPLFDERLLLQQSAAAQIPQKMVIEFATKEPVVLLQPAPYSLDGVTTATDPCLRAPKVGCYLLLVTCYVLCNCRCAAAAGAGGVGARAAAAQQ
jgi:hypothetical protein